MRPNPRGLPAALIFMQNKKAIPFGMTFCFGGDMTCQLLSVRDIARFYLVISVCGKEASVTRIGQQHDRFYCLIFFLIRLARTAYSSSGKTTATLPHLPLAISA